MSLPRRVALLTAVLVTASACVADEVPSPGASATMTPRPSASSTPSPAVTATAAASPTATPEPSLSLSLPESTDPRVVAATVDAAVGAETGTLTITVTSVATERIDELVLRWPTELNEILFLAPFTPSAERIQDGGDPLVQPWTKWVVGPGEQDEPAGTISLGWGPLLPEATLTIKLDVIRRSAGPVAFDLQLLAGNDLLTLAGDEPAELRVEVP